jgi:hypothetical protein
MLLVRRVRLLLLLLLLPPPLRASGLRRCQVRQGREEEEGSKGGRRQSQPQGTRLCCSRACNMRTAPGGALAPAPAASKNNT